MNVNFYTGVLTVYDQAYQHAVKVFHINAASQWLQRQSYVCLHIVTVAASQVSADGQRADARRRRMLAMQ